MFKFYFLVVTSRIVGTSYGIAFVIIGVYLTIWLFSSVSDDFQLQANEFVYGDFIVQKVYGLPSSPDCSENPFITLAEF